MNIPKTLCAMLVGFACVTRLPAQTDAQTQNQTQDQPPASATEQQTPRLLPGSARGLSQRSGSQSTESPKAATQPQELLLTVPKGTSLQVALEKEVRIQKVGQTLDALVIEPVYAFDRLVVPVGSRIRGQVTRIDAVSNGKRVLASLDGDFTPERKVEVQFTDITLADGTHMALHSSVTPGSGQVLKLVSTSEKETKASGVKKSAELKKTVGDAASQRTKEAKQIARDEWNSAVKQLKTPGRMHRLQRYAEAQLPVHRQYIAAGTMYFVELEEPLDFGKEPLTPQMAATLGGPLPNGCVVHARLNTSLSSATAHREQEVEAILTRPLFDGDHLLLPQGSRLKGTVRQVRAARRMKKNGQLRIAFQQIVLPDGIEQRVQAALVGVQAGKDGNVKLDSEGGAEATTSKSRYGAVALSIGLAAASLHHFGDHDGDATTPSGTTGGRAAGGIGGFKLVGAVMGVLVKSRAFGYTMGGYGAGMSIYRNFLARGHEVVFPKNTAMEIGIDTRAGANVPTPPDSKPAEASESTGQ